jgi:hypothetical protein
MISENVASKRAIYEIKRNLGTDLRRFGYHGRRDGRVAYAEFAFDSRDRFDAIVSRIREKTGLELRIERS